MVFALVCDVFQNIVKGPLAHGECAVAVLPCELTRLGDFVLSHLDVPVLIYCLVLRKQKAHFGPEVRFEMSLVTCASYTIRKR